MLKRRVFFLASLSVNATRQERAKIFMDCPDEKVWLLVESSRMLLYAQRTMNSPWGVVMVHLHLALRSCHLVWQFKHSVTPMALTCWVYEEVKRTKKLSRGNCGTLHENNCFYWKDQITCNESNGLVDQVYDQIICNTKFFKKKITDTCTLSHHINAGLPFYWHVKECIRGVTLTELTAGPQRKSFLWEILVRNQNLTGLTPRAGTMK